MTTRTIAPPLVETALQLTPGQFYDEPQAKSAVVLHHTVSGTWSGTVKFWNSDTQRVGTAYGVDRDGTVHRAFPDDRWAVHLFRRRAGGGESGGNFTTPEIAQLERRTIGIELVSLGALTERGPDLLDAYGKRLGRAAELLAAARVVDLGTPWRGVRWFDAYTEPQIVNTIKLVAWLCGARGIPPAVPAAIARAETDPRSWLAFEGILTHAILRPDKTDLSPAFPYDRLAHALGFKTWS